MIMDKKTRYKIAEYCRERDAAVILAVYDGEIEPLKQLGKEYGIPLPSNDRAIEIVAHKMCLAIVTMPRELQDKSRKWLKEHGYKEEIE